MKTTPEDVLPPPPLVEVGDQTRLQPRNSGNKLAFSNLLQTNDPFNFSSFNEKCSPSASTSSPSSSSSSSFSAITQSTNDEKPFSDKRGTLNIRKRSADEFLRNSLEPNSAFFQYTHPETSPNSFTTSATNSVSSTSISSSISSSVIHQTPLNSVLWGNANAKKTSSFIVKAEKCALLAEKFKEKGNFLLASGYHKQAEMYYRQSAVESKEMYKDILYKAADFQHFLSKNVKKILELYQYWKFNGYQQNIKRATEEHEEVETVAKVQDSLKSISRKLSSLSPFNESIISELHFLNEKVMFYIQQLDILLSISIPNREVQTGTSPPSSFLALNDSFLRIAPSSSSTSTSTLISSRDRANTLGNENIALLQAELVSLKRVIAQKDTIIRQLKTDELTKRQEIEKLRTHMQELIDQERQQKEHYVGLYVNLEKQTQSQTQREDPSDQAYQELKQRYALLKNENGRLLETNRVYKNRLDTLRSYVNK